MTFYNPKDEDVNPLPNPRLAEAMKELCGESAEGTASKCETCPARDLCEKIAHISCASLDTELNPKNQQHTAQLIRDCSACVDGTCSRLRGSSGTCKLGGAWVKSNTVFICGGCGNVASVKRPNAITTLAIRSKLTRLDGSPVAPDDLVVILREVCLRCMPPPVMLMMPAPPILGLCLSVAGVYTSADLERLEKGLPL